MGLFKVADRVKETTTSTGTGTINLDGAAANFISFVSGIGTGNRTFYTIVDSTNNAWEVGIGTVTDGSPDTLSRDTILASSNSDAVVNFSAGTKDVFTTYPAMFLNTTITDQIMVGRGNFWSGTF